MLFCQMKRIFNSEFRLEVNKFGLKRVKFRNIKTINKTKQKPIKDSEI